MPVRRRLAPTGLRPSSKLFRQRPSNIRSGYLGVLSENPASRRSARRIPRHLGNSR